MNTFFKILLAIILFPQLVEAQEYHIGQIKFTDGEIIDGFIRPFVYLEPRIFFKADLDSKKEKFYSEEIEEVRFINEEDTLIFRQYQLAKYKQGGAKTKYFNGICWANKIYASESIEAYQFPVLKEKIGLSLITSAFNTSSLGIYFYEHRMSIGIKFPKEDAIIDVAGNGGTKGLDGTKFRKRIKNYLIRHCLAFRKVVRTDTSDSIRDLKEYLDYYSEICHKN